MAAEIRHQMDKEKSGEICLKLDMEAGHFSASDRYKVRSSDELGIRQLRP